MEIDRNKLIKADLEYNLKMTDYVVIKIAEAETDEERQSLRNQYADVIAKRKLWRKAINEL